MRRNACNSPRSVVFLVLVVLAVFPYHQKPYPRPRGGIAQSNTAMENNVVLPS